MYRSDRAVSRSRAKRFLLHFVPGLMFAVLAICSTIAGAQQLTGTLSGTVFDQSGAVIPKATIVLKNESSGDIRNTVSDTTGYFNLSAVQPATYTITISADGFTTWQEPGIAMGQGDARTVANIKLKVGTNTQEIQVISGADAIVPVDTAEVSTTLNAEMINDIALAGRDAGELLKIMPGMALTNGLSQGSSFNTKLSGTNSGPVGSYSSNGTQPNGSMAYMLDGANLIDPGNAGTQIANINQDMTAEVKVLMSSYGAEYAKGPVIFQAFSKSGGSHFHGEGYFYARNSTFNAIDAFAKSQIADKVSTLEGGGESPKQAQADALKAALPDEHYYYMGGNIGGPVLLPFVGFNKDRRKLFFWAGYEYMNQHPAGTPVNYNVPTPAQLSGDFTNAGVPAGVLSSSNSYAYQSATNNLPVGATSSHIPTSTFDPNAAAILKLYPKPNITPSGLNGWNNYQYVSAVPQNRWEATGKIDYAISDNTKLTGSYTRQIEKDSHPIAIWWAAPWTLPYPSPVSAATTSNEVMTNFTHVFNATTTNEFVFTLARYINPSTLTNPSAVDRSKLGFNVAGLFGHTASQLPNIEGPWGGAFPNISEEAFDGKFNGGGSFGGLKKDPSIYDNVSKVIGNHSLKAGVYWDSNENIQSNGGADNGTYNVGWGQYGTGNVVSDFLLGRNGNYQQASSIPVDDIKFHQWSLYAQDSWKANKQLTLNYGVRFDHVGQWYDTSAGLQVWDPSTYVNALPANAPANTGLLWHKINSAIPQSGFVSPLFYVEPRVGMAYDVFGTGKTVIRGGLAVFRYQLAVNDIGAPAAGPEGAFTFQINNPDGPLNPATGQNAGYAGIANFVAPSGSTQNGASISAISRGDNRTPSTMDWNVTLSQALPWRSVFEVSYVANKSSNELINGSNGKFDDLNNILPGSQFLPDPNPASGNFGKVQSPSAPACGTGKISDNPNYSLYCVGNQSAYSSSTAYNANDWRPLLGYQDIYLITHGSYANYNSIQSSWQKQSGPVTYLINYTFSKLMGIRDGQTDNGAGNGTMVDPFNLKSNYGPLAYDHTQIFNAAYVWNLPKPLHGNPILAEAVNGWQISGYTTLQSGAPLQPNLNGNLNAQYPGNLTVPTQAHPNLPDNSILLPNGLRAVAMNTQTWFGSNSYNLLLPVVTCDPRKHLSKGQYFNPSCFGPSVYGQQGTLSWPYLRGPAYFNSDLAIFKNFKITENQKLQFRLSATNFLNHPLKQFGLSGQSDEQLSFVGQTPATCSGCVDTSNGNAPLTVQYLSQTNTNPQTTGKPSQTVGSRSLLFALKYYF